MRLEGGIIMMVLKKLRIGSMIKFINEDKTTFDGYVKAIIGISFIVHVPVLQQNYMPSRKGKKIEYLVGFEVEAFKCASFIMEAKTNSEFETLVLSMPEVIMVVERRAFSRVKAVLPVSYYLLHKNEFYRELNEVPSNYWKKTKTSFTLDIGGGGVSLISSEKSDLAQCTLIKFNIKKEIKVLSSVIRSVPNEKDAKYVTAFKFEDINEEDRSIIINYVNEKLKNE